MAAWAHYTANSVGAVISPIPGITQKGLRWLDEQQLSFPYDRSLANHRAPYDFVHREVEHTTERLMEHNIDERALELLLWTRFLMRI